METSPRLQLPLISAGQSQKEVLHNEALLTLDLLVPAVVEEGPRDDPPMAAAVGSCFIVGANPSGAWATHGAKLAAFSAAGWRFVEPPEGLHAWVKSLNVTAVHRGGTWGIGEVCCTRITVSGNQVLGEQVPAIATPAGGAVADVQARETIDAILFALRQHGLIAT